MPVIRNRLGLGLLFLLCMTIAALPALAQSAREKAETEAINSAYRQMAEQGNAQAAVVMSRIGGSSSAGWLSRAAELGDPEAQSNLGSTLMRENKKEAIDWLTKAALSGDLGAALNIGACYFNGWGTGKDLAQAYAWYTLADRDVGATVGLTAAIQQMAQQYLDMTTQRLTPDQRTAGEAQAADLKARLTDTAKTRAVAEKAATEARIHELAEQGNSVAQTRLALKTFGSKDPAEAKAAITWYQMAAESGNALAEYQLGRAFSNGLGVEKNESEAMAHYKKAADHGRADAQFELGNAYANGTGVAPDNGEAYFWLSLVAQQGGNPPLKMSGQSARDRVAKTLSRTEISEQDARIRAWKPISD